MKIKSYKKFSINFEIIKFFKKKYEKLFNSLYKQKLNSIILHLLKNKIEINTVYDVGAFQGDWTKLLKTDDNYKNQLQVKIQKEFKTTPDYLELRHDMETGYEMGVYLCLGQTIHESNKKEAKKFSEFGNFTAIHNYLLEHDKLLIYLGKGVHKIKKKAEQFACENVLNLLTPVTSETLEIK